MTGVVHSGAAVKLGASWSDLKDANVGGTLSAIELASALRPGAMLLYVSTNGIFPADATENPKVWAEDCDTSALPDLLQPNDGYGLTKWTAETLVLRAHREQKLPVVVVRLGNLGWCSQTGAGNPRDFQSMIISGCARLGAALDTKWHVELTPVDLAAAHTIKCIATSIHAKSGAVVHISDTQPTSFEEVCFTPCP